LRKSASEFTDKYRIEKLSQREGAICLRLDKESTGKLETLQQRLLLSLVTCIHSYVVRQILNRNYGLCSN
jgi:hypothetical protein